MANQHTLSEVEALVAELHALARAGLTRVEAKKVFKGRRGKSWVEVNWPTSKPSPIQQIYGDQNVVPSIRRIAVERGGKAWHTAGSS